MKKIWIALLLLSLLSPLPIKAQHGEPASFRFGLTVSPLISWMNPETRNYESEGARAGYSYGIRGDFRLGTYAAVATGLQFAQHGGKLSFPFEDPTIAETTRERFYRFRYLEIPIGIKMNTVEIGYFTYYGSFSLVPALNLSASARDETRLPGAILVEEDVDIKPDTRFLKAALVLEVGTEYSLGGRTSLLAAISYQNGFTNVLKGRNPVSDRMQSATAHYVGLKVGVMF